MKLFSSKIYQSFILFTFTFLLSMVSHALSPELLEKIKNETIVDMTNTLSPDEIRDLKVQNEQLYQKNKVDFKILILNSIGSMPIEEFAGDIFNSTQIGSKELDNGLLLFIAKADHKMRLEVGYGLEGDLTDIEAGQIIRNTLAPNFKNEQYYQGLHQTQQILINKNITFNEAKIKRHHIISNLKMIGILFLSILFCIPLYWLYTKAVLNYGMSAGFGVFVGILIFEIFIHLMFFAYIRTPDMGFFMCALIPLYAPFLIILFLPNKLSHKLLKCILYSLPPQVFSMFGLWIFYYVDFLPSASFILANCLTIVLILIYLRYLLLLYRFKNGTENAYLTSFYNDYLKEQERQKMIDERYERLNKLKILNQTDSSDSSSSSSSSSSFSNSDSSSSSSSSSSDSSSSSSRDSGGSSGGGGASGSW